MNDSPDSQVNAEISNIYTDVTLYRGKKSAKIKVGPNMIIVPENCRELTRSLLEELGIGYLMRKKNVAESKIGVSSYSLDEIPQKDYVKVMNLKLLVPKKLNKGQIDVFNQPDQTNQKTTCTKEVLDKLANNHALKKRKHRPSYKSNIV
jgi:hypothetical protein